MSTDCLRYHSFPEFNGCTHVQSDEHSWAGAERLEEEQQIDLLSSRLNKFTTLTNASKRSTVVTLLQPHIQQIWVLNGLVHVDKHGLLLPPQSIVTYQEFYHLLWNAPFHSSLEGSSITKNFLSCYTLVRISDMVDAIVECTVKFQLQLLMVMLGKLQGNKL